MKCERCGFKGWLYWLGSQRLCDACWTVAATDAAILAGKRRLDLSQKKPVAR